MGGRERIKKLAKKSLEEKWYPIQKIPRPLTYMDLDHDCAFCYDAKIRDKKNPCKVCYISKMTPNICNDMSVNNVDKVIKLLEQLAENGEIL